MKYGRTEMHNFILFQDPFFEKVVFCFVTIIAFAWINFTQPISTKTRTINRASSIDYEIYRKHTI